MCLPECFLLATWDCELSKGLSVRVFLFAVSGTFPPYVRCRTVLELLNE